LVKGSVAFGRPRIYFNEAFSRTFLRRKALLTRSAKVVEGNIDGRARSEKNFHENQSNGERRRQMTILKVIEVLTESNKSWEDAAQEAVREAAKTVENIRSIYIKDFQAVVENQKIIKYRVNAKISFEISK
jgi:hypothetical protein